MSDQTTQVEKSLPAAPIESGHTPDQAYNFVEILTVETKTDVVYSGTLLNAIKSNLVGMSKVDLISLSIRYVFTRPEQSISCGVCGEGAPFTIEQLPFLPGAFTVMANQMNVGVQHDNMIVVPNTLSVQIYPTSAQAPALKIMLRVDEGVKCALTCNLKFSGPLMRISSLTTLKA